MKFVIAINYKNKELYQKVIKTPLNSEIKVLKEEINGFEIRRIN